MSRPSSSSFAYNLLFALLFSTISSLAVADGVARPRKLILVQQQPLVLKYHNGLVLKGNYTVHLLWYGKFSPAQRAVVADFARSLGAVAAPPPSVASWWRTTERYGVGSVPLSLGQQLIDERYSLGKSLTATDISTLASRGPHRNAVTAVLTASDVSVAGFCLNRCGFHGSARVPTGRHRARFAYLWVGDSAAQCPGQCAWPFHQPIYGPQTPPLVAPNSDVGMDGVVISLATLLADAVTNPNGDGYFQGPPSAPLEAVTACTGIFGSGAYPGYPGKVLVDPASGASYNAHGAYGRKYLLPAMWDPKSFNCSTLV